MSSIFLLQKRERHISIIGKQVCHPEFSCSKRVPCSLVQHCLRGLPDGYLRGFVKFRLAVNLFGNQPCLTLYCFCVKALLDGGLKTFRCVTNKDGEQYHRLASVTTAQ